MTTAPNLYQRIYEKKSSEELKSIVSDPNVAIDTRHLAISILEQRGELSGELRIERASLESQRTQLLNHELATDQYNTLWQRLAANTIDSTLLKILGYTAGYFYSGDISTAVAVLVNFFPFVYSIAFHSLFGQTIGKMFMGIKVFDRDEHTSVNFRKAFLRDCIPLLSVAGLSLLALSGEIYETSGYTQTAVVLSAIIISWAVLEIITLLFHKKRRALHDLIAGTVVLKIRDR